MHLPATFWMLLAGCALVYALLWWVVLGAGRAARRRALDARIRLWESTHTPPSAATLQALRGAALAARRALCAQTDRQRLYGQPWVLFVGDPAADLLSLLAAAHPAGPVQAQAADAGEGFWRWWLMARMAAIEVCPPPMAPTQPQDALWLRALRELALLRPRLPLNGVALCVSVGALQADGSVARPIIELLCRRVNDTVRGLRVQLPVYVIVTGLQRLPGHAAVQAALPAEALAHALGCRVSEEADAPDAYALDRLFHPLVLRLQALRLGLLREATEAPQRADIHAFVEAVQGLEPGLALLMERLGHAGHTDGGRQAAPLRGLYFTASGTQSAFVGDLFQRFMPEDQGLARPRP